jgi:hypothetical protein
VHSRTSGRLRCHSSRVKALAAMSSAAFSSGRLDKAQKYAPVLYERDGPASGLLLGRRSDTRTQLGHGQLSRGARGGSRVAATDSGPDRPLTHRKTFGRGRNDRFHLLAPVTSDGDVL